MNTREYPRLTGRLHIELRGSDGKIKDVRDIDNLVVNTGLAFTISRMIDASKPVMSHMALGAGITPPVGSNTDLEAPLGARVAITSATQAGINNDQVVYVCDFPAGSGTGPVTEAGIFNDATGGDMLCRTVFAIVTKAADDTMLVTWTITLGAA